MKLKSAFVALVCLFFMLGLAKGFSKATANAEHAVNTECLLSSLLIVYEDGIVPAPVIAAQTAPASVRSPYPVVKFTSIPSGFSNLSVHQRFAYSFKQPVLHQASTPLYLVNRLLLI